MALLLEIEATCPLNVDRIATVCCYYYYYLTNVLRGQLKSNLTRDPLNREKNKLIKQNENNRKE